MRKNTDKELEFLRKYADLCEEYNMAIVSEDPYDGTEIFSGEWAKSRGDKSMEKAFEREMAYIRNGLVSPMEHLIGKKVTFRDTGRSGTIITADCLFAEGYSFVAIMDDNGASMSFTNDDNFYIT